MRYVYRRLMLLAICATMGLAWAGCDGDIDLPDPVARDFDAIQEGDTLVALMTFNSTSYFIYRGQPMGYEYELLQAFAEDHDLELRVEVVSDRDSLFYLLNSGVGDVVAARVVPAAADTNRIRFTQALYETAPGLVQRSGPPSEIAVPESVDSALEAIVPDTSVFQAFSSTDPDSVKLEARLIRRPSELAGETVHLPSNPAFQERLVELEEQVTGDIHVVEADGATSEEELIRRIAQGEINLLVSQSNVAKLKESYFTNITVKPQIGPPVAVAWAVRDNAPALQQALDEWIASQPGRAEALYQKYYVDRRGYREREQSEYLTSETGRLSPYDDLFQTYADTLGWDWRLLASQSYQESKFDPDARSWAGAAGLLQLMPPTARQYGVADSYDPDANVAGAVRFIAWLQEYWAEHIPDEQERLKFILASYNTGHGHVEDARRLTVKNGGDDTSWEDVAYWLLQKSKREVYTDPMVKYGFCRGLEPVTYVTLILDRYDHYRQFVVT